MFLQLSFGLRNHHLIKDNGYRKPLRQSLHESTALAKRVLRKIDLRILVIMFVTYILILWTKRSCHPRLEEDNHLVSKQYS